MNNKSKNKIRNASNSRESRSNLASNSKEKPIITKYKSEKNLFLKTKTNTQNLQSKSKEHSKNSSRPGYENFPDHNKPHKSSKQEHPSEEYYNHSKKAKSKNKLHQQEEIEKQKKSYFESLYMHKEDEDHLQNCLDNSFDKHNENSTETVINSNLKMVKKIKLIERHAAIDANGKFVTKETKKTERKQDTQQHTISVFENTKNSIAANTILENKKSNQNLKMKKDKIKVKTKNSELHEADLVSQNKSIMKSVMKLKKHTSNGKDPKEIKEIRDLKGLKEENNFTKKCVENKEPKQLIRETTRLQSQREAIQTSSTKTIQSLETEASPQFLVKNNFISCLSESLISYEEIIKEIEEERQNLKILRQPITNQEYLQERIKSIDFIGKICHLMSIKREAHSLAVIYLDSYVEVIISSTMKDKEKRKLFKLNEETINFPELIKNLKLYAITCLLLALKMDDGLMARKLCFELNTNLENLLKSSQSKINQKMKESIAHLHGYTSTSTTKESRKESVYSLTKSKTNITSLSSTKLIEDNKESRKLVKKEDGFNIDMNSIMKIETDILLKFKFKLTVKSPQYWIDALTFLWDDYLNAQVSWEEMLYFRENDYTTNISHLLQLLEKTFLSLEVYQFPTFTIILAIMYLVIRIKLEEQKECENLKSLYEKYRANLMKSTNIIFYDNIGINELYGDFLTQMNLSLSDIVAAVKYVGQYLSYDTLKQFSFNNKSKQVNNRYGLHEHRLSLYQYNAEIYAGWK